MVRKPCVFFDRDGIANESPGEGKYVEHWNQFKLLPEFIAALQVTLQHGYEAVIVTNQRGVARGRMRQEDVDEIHRNLRAALRGRGLHLRDIFVCTDESDASPRRKPNPGMLLEAAEQHHLDLARSWMVGDQERDVEAGRRAGCRTVLVNDSDKPSRADFRLAAMSELAGFLKEHLEPCGAK